MSPQSKKCGVNSGELCFPFVVCNFQFAISICSDFSAMAAYSRRRYVCVYVYTYVHVYKHVWCIYTCTHTSADPVC